MVKLFTESPLDPAETRNPGHSVAPIFLHRWSPRAFVREPMPEGIVGTLFEAARWAPSSRNEQPWLFLWSMVGDPEREVFESLLRRGNAWAKNAGLLVFLFAKRRFDHNDRRNRTALFDCGSAWMSLALQARELGLYAHGMAGIRTEEAYGALEVPEEDFEVVCGIAVGRYGDRERVQEEKRVTPNGRKPLAQVAIRGRFDGD